MTISKIDKILKNKLSNRHSSFQLEYFIVASEPTHQAKIHQCLIELQGRKKTLESVEMEIMDLIDRRDLMILEKEQITANTEKEKLIKMRMAERRIVHANDKIQELKDTQKVTEEESEILLKLYDFLVSQEDVKDWDSTEVQKEYWNAQLLRELRIKAILGNPIDTTLVKTIFAMPDNTPVKNEIIRIVKNNMILESDPKNLNTDTNGQ